MDVQTCQRHKRVAETARAQLTQLKIKSNNKFWQTTKTVSRGLDTQRSAFGYGNVTDNVGIAYGSWRPLENDEFIADVTFTLGAGNCDEKASVFGVLASRDPRSKGSHIYRCAFSGYDHVIAIMCTIAGLSGRNDLSLRDFGDDAVILDGWAEDWWFPNISVRKTLQYHLWRLGDPFAMKVRASSQHCNLLDVSSQIS